MDNSVMKFIPPRTLESDIQDKISKLKHELKRKQHPKKHAPIIPSDLLITISGCTFRAHKQEGKRLTIKADQSINFNNNINVLRAISYISGALDYVSIGGWDWRPINFTKDKLVLKAVAPSSL